MTATSQGRAQEYQPCEHPDLQRFGSLCVPPTPALVRGTQQSETLRRASVPGTLPHPGFTSPVSGINHGLHLAALRYLAPCGRAWSFWNRGGQGCFPAIWLNHSLPPPPQWQLQPQWALWSQRENTRVACSFVSLASWRAWRLHLSAQQGANRRPRLQLQLPPPQVPAGYRGSAAGIMCVVSWDESSRRKQLC